MPPAQFNGLAAIGGGDDLIPPATQGKRKKAENSGFVIDDKNCDWRPHITHKLQQYYYEKKEIYKKSGAVACFRHMAAILVVDDEEFIISLIRATLERAGHEGHTSASGGEGELTNALPRIDLLIVDYDVLPDNGHLIAGKNNRGCK